MVGSPAQLFAFHIPPSIILKKPRKAKQEKGKHTRYFQKNLTYLYPTGMNPKDAGKMRYAPTILFCGGSIQ